MKQTTDSEQLILINDLEQGNDIEQTLTKDMKLVSSIEQIITSTNLEQPNDSKYIPAIKWGIYQEDRARQEYIREISQCHQNSECIQLQG